MTTIGRFAILLMLVWTGWVQAQSAPQFPPLSGGVVDQAELLSPQAEARLTQLLAAHEQQTSNQVVVVTLPDLQGYEIADYGYQLGRHWGIGQKGKDNGVLLIVALAERKMRIEVGYGLEGQLTDAASSLIINQVMTPLFREGRYEQGILAGVQAILMVLEAEPGAVPAAKQQEERMPAFVPFVMTLIFFLLVMFLNGGRGRRVGRYRRGVYVGGLGGFGGGFGGGGLGGGGFRGGGGGFGGGGASGGW